MLVGLAGFSALLAVPQPLWAYAPQATRFLALDNTHTGEKLRITYWADGKYLQGALAEINKHLRDHRTGEVHAIDPRLLDKICAVYGKMDSTRPFEIISGYRSAATNGLLHQRSKGVAKRSLHMDGKAIDLRLPGRELSALRNAALSLNDGGVGFYPGSQFVHVDTGKTRRW